MLLSRWSTVGKKAEIVLRFERKWDGNIYKHVICSRKTLIYLQFNLNSEPVSNEKEKLIN